MASEQLRRPLPEEIRADPPDGERQSEHQQGGEAIRYRVLADLGQVGEPVQQQAVDERERPERERCRDERQPVGEHHLQVGDGEPQPDVVAADHRAVDDREQVPEDRPVEDRLDPDVERTAECSSTAR